MDLIQEECARLKYPDLADVFKERGAEERPEPACGVVV